MRLDPDIMELPTLIACCIIFPGNFYPEIVSAVFYGALYAYSIIKYDNVKVKTTMSLGVGVAIGFGIGR
jgi:hypothetical protein